MDANAAYNEYEKLMYDEVLMMGLNAADVCFQNDHACMTLSSTLHIPIVSEYDGKCTKYAIRADDDLFELTRIFCTQNNLNVDKSPKLVIHHPKSLLAQEQTQPYLQAYLCLSMTTKIYEIPFPNKFSVKMIARDAKRMLKVEMRSGETICYFMPPNANLLDVKYSHSINFGMHVDSFFFILYRKAAYDHGNIIVCEDVQDLFTYDEAKLDSSCYMKEVMVDEEAKKIREKAEKVKKSISDVIRTMNAEKKDDETANRLRKKLLQRNKEALQKNMEDDNDASNCNVQQESRDASAQLLNGVNLSQKELKILGINTCDWINQESQPALIAEKPKRKKKKKNTVPIPAIVDTPFVETGLDAAHAKDDSEKISYETTKEIDQDPDKLIEKAVQDSRHDAVEIFYDAVAQIDDKAENISMDTQTHFLQPRLSFTGQNDDDAKESSMEVTEVNEDNQEDAQRQSDVDATHEPQRDDTVEESPMEVTKATEDNQEDAHETQHDDTAEESPMEVTKAIKKVMCDAECTGKENTWDRIYNTVSRVTRLHRNKIVAFVHASLQWNGAFITEADDERLLMYVYQWIWHRDLFDFCSDVPVEVVQCVCLSAGKISPFFAYRLVMYVTSFRNVHFNALMEISPIEREKMFAETLKDKKFMDLLLNSEFDRMLCELYWMECEFIESNEADENLNRYAHAQIENTQAPFRDISIKTLKTLCKAQDVSVLWKHIYDQKQRIWEEGIEWKDDVHIMSLLSQDHSFLKNIAGKHRFYEHVKISPGNLLRMSTRYASFF